MTQEVKIGDDIVILDTEKVYSGEGNQQQEGKLVRKALALPVSKPLIFYRDIHNADSAISVKDFVVLEMYDITIKWYTLELTLISGDKVRIHSSFFADMQKPSFIADMAAQVN